MKKGDKVCWRIKDDNSLGNGVLLFDEDKGHATVAVLGVSSGATNDNSMESTGLLSPVVWIDVNRLRPYA